MRKPRLRRTRKLFRNVRAVWQFLKPQVHIYARKPRFTRLGLRWTHEAKVGTIRRVKSREDLRRVKLVRKLLKRYRISYSSFGRDPENVEEDRYRLIGWSLRRQVQRPAGRASEYIEHGPWVVGPRSDKEERLMWKSGHPTSTRESSSKPSHFKDASLQSAYEADIWDCIDVEFHSGSCGCPECLPEVAVGEFTASAPTTRTRKPRKKTQKPG